MIKYLIRNITFMNLLLFAALFFLAGYIVLPLFTSAAKYTPPPAKKAPVEGNEQQQQPQIQAPSPMDYVIIADQNLFHPERRIPVQEMQQPLPKPEFILYGTLITDEVSLAYLEDMKSPQSTTGRGKRQTVLRKGETMSGFVLKEVEADKVVMVKGEEKMVVILLDPEKAKTREAGTMPPATQQPPSRPGSMMTKPGAAQKMPQRLPVTPQPSVPPSPAGPPIQPSYMRR
jgi:hypothetical protein